MLLFDMCLKLMMTLADKVWQDLRYVYRMFCLGSELMLNLQDEGGGQLKAHDRTD